VGKESWVLSSSGAASARWHGRVPTQPL
jgi:hypothetical protein